MATISTQQMGKTATVNIYCTDTEKTIVAELIRMEKDKITVILPGYQKMILNKTSKPGFYTTTKAGMEFTCNTQAK